MSWYSQVLPWGKPHGVSYTNGGFSTSMLLVGGIPTPLKNMKVSWGYYSQYMEK